MFLGQNGGTTFGFNTGIQTNPFRNTSGNNINATPGTNPNPAFATPLGTSPFAQTATTQLPFAALGNTTTSPFGIHQPTNPFAATPAFNQNNNNPGTGFFTQPQQIAFQTTQTPSLFTSPQNGPMNQTFSFFNPNPQPIGTTNQTPSLFSSTTQGFNSHPMDGTTTKFSPVAGIDTTINKGLNYTVQTRNHCITTMQEYKNKSLEELRFEDYKVGRKGPQSVVPFGIPNQLSEASTSNAPNLASFTFNNQTGTTSFFNKPLTGFTVPTTNQSSFFNKPLTGFSVPTTTNQSSFFNKPFNVSTTTFPSAVSQTSPFKVTQSTTNSFNQNKPLFTWPTTSSTMNSSFRKPSGFNPPGNNYQLLFPGTRPNENPFKDLGWTEAPRQSSVFNQQNPGNSFANQSSTSVMNETAKSFPSHEQILAMAATPFGDSPLLRNLPSARKAETLEKMINLNRGTRSSQYKISTNNSSRIKPKIATSRSTHKMLFDGFEEETTFVEIFHIRPSAKRLVLRAKPNTSKSESAHKMGLFEESGNVDKENQSNALMDTENQSNSLMGRENQSKENQSSSLMGRETSRTVDRENQSRSSMDKENLPSSSMDRENQSRSSMDKENLSRSLMGEESLSRSLMDKENVFRSSIDEENQSSSFMDKENQSNSFMDKGSQSSSFIDNQDQSVDDSDSRSSTSWLKTSMKRNRSQGNDEQSSFIESETLDNTIIELRPSLTNKDQIDSPLINSSIVGSSKSFRLSADLIEDSDSIQDSSSIQDSGFAQDSDSMQEGSLLIQERPDLIQERSDLIQEGSDLVQEGSDLIQEETGLIQEETDLIEEESDLIQGFVSIQKVTDSIQEDLDLTEEGFVSIQQVSVSYKKDSSQRFAEAAQLSKRIGNLAQIKLERSDYYTIPSLEQLEQYVRDGTCIVPHFTIGRKGYGQVFYPESCDVFGLNLDEIVQFKHKEVIIYPDDDKKPPIGQGLNREAQITLHRIWPRDESQKAPITDAKRLEELNYVEKLVRISEKHNTAFLEYRPETGSWVFKVKHF